GRVLWVLISLAEWRRQFGFGFFPIFPWEKPNSGSAQVIFNGTTSSFFSIQRGVRQGDPLSGPLFVLALEPLLFNLRALPISFPPSQSDSDYCDDVLALLQDVNDAPAVLNYLDTTSPATG